MLEKNTSQTERYKVNDMTMVTVKNVPAVDDRGRPYFKSEVTLKHRLTSDSPIEFQSHDDISDFVNNIEIEDNQLSLISPNLNN